MDAQLALVLAAVLWDPPPSSLCVSASAQAEMAEGTAPLGSGALRAVHPSLPPSIHASYYIMPLY